MTVKLGMFSFSVSGSCESSAMESLGGGLLEVGVWSDGADVAGADLSAEPPELIESAFDRRDSLAANGAGALFAFAL